MEIEKDWSPEQKEEIKSIVELSIFRHDAKENDKTKSDTEIRLTPEGRQHAADQADGETNIEQAVAFGSPRERAQETAGLAMSGGEEEITGTESLEELREKLDKDLSYGSKIAVDPRLDFTLDFETPYGAAELKAFKEGTLMKFLVEESDQLAEELKDEKNGTYSRQSRQIAQIIEKYITVSKNWSKIVEEKNKEDNVLRRFLGSHQSVPECFLAKVIEKMKGVEERDKFVEALGNQGFGFSEGYKVEVVDNGSDKPKIHLSYKKSKDDKEVFVFDEDVDSELIKEIAKPEMEAVEA